MAGSNKLRGLNKMQRENLHVAALDEKNKIATTLFVGRYLVNEIRLPSSDLACKRCQQTEIKAFQQVKDQRDDVDPLSAFLFD